MRTQAMADAIMALVPEITLVANSYDIDYERSVDFWSLETEHPAYAEIEECWLDMTSDLTLLVNQLVPIHRELSLQRMRQLMGGDG